MKFYHTWTWLAAAKPASSSILSRVIVEQKSRDEAVKEQQKTTDKQEKAVRFSLETSKWVRGFSIFFRDFARFIEFSDYFV